MIDKDKFDDILIVDKKGEIIFGEVSDPKYYGFESTMGGEHHIREFYLGINENYPTLTAAKKGIVRENFEVTLRTNEENKPVIKKCTAYPIYDGKKPIAAIECSKICSSEDNSEETNEKLEYLSYRNNNTIYELSDIITGDNNMLNLKSQIEKYALVDSSVFLYGETGTGKDMIAQAIHNCSRRYARKFVTVSCGTLPKEGLEEMLFGVSKKSFEGAQDKPGLFEQAEGGTIFLDDVNSLDPVLQAKLLNVAETKSVRRVGEFEGKKVDVRIIAAVNEDPNVLISTGRLDIDLFYRLAVIYVYIPALRDRGIDINLITDYFIDYFNRNMNSNIKEIDDDVRKIFNLYDWPGNVRELKNIIEGAFAFAKDNRITLDEIPPYIINKCDNTKNKHIKAVYQGEETSLSGVSDRIEAAIVYDAYEKEGQNLTKAALKLGISKQLLSYKLTKYGR